MRRTLPLALSAAVALAACQDTPSPASPDLSPPTADAPSASPQSVNVIVTLNPDFAPGGHQANQRAADAVARGLGLNPSHTYGTALFGFAATVPEGRLNGLRNDPRVAAVEVDQVVTLAPPPGRGPGGGGDGGDGSTTQSTPWGITRVGGAGDGTGKTAWIIDSGIDLDHPDLNVDVGRSVDFTGSRKGPEDENGHGTHVAGTVAAIDNSEGVVGVAAGATVVAVRVLDRRGSGSYSGVIAGVDYVGANGASGDVANMSLGGGFSQALNQAVVNAAGGGVKFVLAAGNSGANAANYSPASANGANVYTISAFAKGDTWASFSNWGNPPVDYAAPGVSILSTYKDGGYATLNGTSMASPHAAGILLLGNARTGGTVSGDPDGNPDPIAIR
ncbi:MAG TPA: S8 family serine peptidase [Longimicrobiales bacterium]|nr:S8 family serine peptidase [Longimicrobiales bacterium]